MFFASLRLLRAITVILCLLVRPWRHFGSNLAPLGALWALLGSLLAIFLAPPEPFCASLGLSQVSLGPLSGLPLASWGMFGTFLGR